MGVALGDNRRHRAVLSYRRRFRCTGGLGVFVAVAVGVTVEVSVGVGVSAAVVNCRRAGSPCSV